MNRQKIKIFIINIFSNYALEFIFSLKKFYNDILFNLNQLVIEWKYLYILKTSLVESSQNLTYKKIIEKTFHECYSVLEKSNILYFGEVEKNCYRFITVDTSNDIFKKAIKQLLNEGYILDIKTATKKNKLIFGRNTSIDKISKHLKGAILIRIFKIYTNSNNIEEFGKETAFEIEIWKKSGELYLTKSINYIQNKLTENDLTSTIITKIFNKDVKQIKELYYYYEFLDKQSVNEVDIVYTWVDGNDENWLQKKNKYDKYDKNIHSSSNSSSRFISRDELKYSLRSLQKYFNGYRKIFIVTDNQKPDWLKEIDDLIIVDHKEIFPNTYDLPVFNSHAIETNLHRIKGLSEHYLYINDDILFGRSVDVSLFFPKKGYISIFPSTFTYIPFGNKHKNLLPVDTAAINTKQLLLKNNIGFAINKFKHTPLPQIKSVLYELENKFLDELVKTSKSRFRHPDDISLTSSLLHNYAYLNNIAIKSEIKYSYINIGTEDYIFKLKKVIRNLVKNRPDVFCINDVNSKIYDSNRIKKILNYFLQDKSFYEK